MMSSFRQAILTARLRKSSDGNLTVKQIIDLVCERFDVTAETAREDVDSFISELISNGLVEISDSPIRNESL